MDQVNRDPGLNHFGKSDSQAERMAKDAKAASKAAKGQQVLLGKAARECSRQERVEWLKKQFKLTSSPFLKTTVDLDKAVDVLLEFWDSFSHDGSYGKTHLLKHRIITEDVPPIKCRY